MAICLFDMENVYFEDDAGVSPQWLAVRVKVKGGLIPALGILAFIASFRCEALLRLCPRSRVWRSAFFDIENVYSEDNAGVSPQWLAVGVRLQGGLIPAYRDSCLCSRVPLLNPAT